MRREAGLDDLSASQYEVLELLAAGLSTCDIAGKLFISPITVRHHVQAILGTLRVHRRLDAVLAWIQRLNGVRAVPHSGGDFRSRSRQSRRAGSKPREARNPSRSN